MEQLAIVSHLPKSKMDEEVGKHRGMTGNAYYEAIVPPICRDRGRVEWMRGPCACPPSGAIRVPHVIRTNRVANKDRHKAPSHPSIHPLSLQNGSDISY